MRPQPLVLLLVACTWSGSSRAQPAATLEYFKGHVRVNSGGKGAAAQLKQELVEADVVEVDTDSFALLRLKNGYLVRLDDDLSVKVSDLALLREPPAAESGALQLSRLLSPAERSEGGERLAGFSASISSADAPPVQPQAPGAEGISGGAPAARASHRSITDFASASPASAGAPGGQPPAAPPPPAQPGVALSASESAPSESKSEADSVQPQNSRAMATPREAKRKAAPQLAWSLRSQIGTVVQTVPPPALLNDPARGSVLRACLQSSLGRLSRPLGQVEVLLQVREHRVVRTALGGGLSAPECLLPYLNQPVPEVGTPAWMSFEVPLK